MRDWSLNPKIAPNGVIVISVSAEHPYLFLGRNLNVATPRVFITDSRIRKIGPGQTIYSVSVVHTPWLCYSMSAPSRKRRRPPVVCSECRRRKSACDRRTPCAQCTQHGLVCVYQNDHSASQRPAPEPSRESLISTTTNTSSEHSRISITASEDTAAIVATPRVRATPLGGPIEGVVNDATFLIPGAILIPPVTASSTSGTLNQGEGHLQPQNRAWVNFDGTLSPNGQSLFTRDHQTSDHKGRYLKSRLVGQSHWMNGCFQVSI